MIRSIFYKNQLEEVVLNAPEILLDLLNIEKRNKKSEYRCEIKFSEKTVIDYFNLEKFCLVWDEGIEISYDNFIFKKNITKSNLIKKNNFLISIEHQKQLQQIFIDKYIIKYEDYEYNILEEQIKSYKEIVKFSKDEITQALLKIDSLYKAKENYLNKLIIAKRTEYYEIRVTKERMARKDIKRRDEEEGIKMNIRIGKNILKLRKEDIKCEIKVKSIGSNINEGDNVVNNEEVEENKEKVDNIDNRNIKSKGVKIQLKQISLDNLNAAFSQINKTIKYLKSK